MQSENSRHWPEICDVKLLIRRETAIKVKEK